MRFLAHTHKQAASLLQVDDAALGVGSVATEGALVGHLLGRDVGRKGGRLVCDAGGGGPHGLPGLVGAGHVVRVGGSKLGFAFGVAVRSGI